MRTYLVCVTETRRAWYRVQADNETDARDQYGTNGELTDWRGVSEAVESVEIVDQG